MAGVAGFEPTNDGVRGSMGEVKSGNFCAWKIVEKLPFLAENRQTPIKNSCFLRFFLLPKIRL